MADGSSEGSHVAGTSAGTLRADEEAVKESKQGRAEDSLTGWSCVCGSLCVGMWQVEKRKLVLKKKS